MIEAKLHTLLRLDHWRAATAKQQRDAAAAIADTHSETLALVRTDAGDFGLPAFAHRATGVMLHLVPGGSFTMGLSDAELARLQAQYSFFNDADDADSTLMSGTLRPPTAIDLPAFLLAARPLGGLQLEWLLASPEERTTLAQGSGKKSWDYAKVAKLPAAQYLAYLDQSGSGEVENDQVEPIEGLLHALGLRLPSEAEWERAARGGDDRTFPHGNEIPEDPSTGINPFGFADLGATCDVCADGAVATLEGIPADGSARPPGPHRIVRGGAANIYPWQGPGWALLVCAMRNSMESEDGLLSIRPAMSL